jgi:copper transport protein
MPAFALLPRARPTALAALLAVALLAALALPGVVAAHANVERAEPAADSTVASAPSMVHIWFTEPVAPNASGIQVLNTAGRRVDMDDSRVDASNPRLMMVSLHPLPDGTYTVAWHNTSTVDGHPLRGTYAFSVGEAPAFSGGDSATATSEVSPLDPIARWAVLGGLLVALGVEWFALAILLPVIAAREARTAPIAIDRRIVGTALGVFAVGAVVHLALQPAGEAGLAGLVTGTRWGQLWALRAALVAVAALVWLRAGADPRARLAVLALLAAAATTLSFASHGAATRGLEVTAVANDIVHTLASALWVGGLVALLAVVRASRVLPTGRRGPFLRAVTQRFSPLALIITAALLITGLYATWLQVAAWSAFDTPYGWAVIAKVGVYAALVAVAAVNLLWVTRRLSGTPSAAGMLGRTVSVEVALVMAALLAAGVLTSLEPAREAIGGGSAMGTARSGSVTAQIAVVPGSIGVNRIEVQVDDRGRPLSGDASSVTLSVKFAGADLGAREVPLSREPSGAYVAERVVLSLEGPWQFDLGVSGGGTFDVQASARIPIGPAGMQGIALPAQSTALLAAGWQVVLLALVVLVVSEAFWKGTRTARRANWGGTALVVVGIMMVYGVGHLHQGGTPVGGRANPILSTDESVALGRELYQTRCAGCHGIGGLGDGPDAAGLNPPPAQLPLHVPLHSDGDIFAFIEGGFPGSAMPAYRGALTEEEMWHLVNYLRTLKLPGQ